MATSYDAHIHPNLYLFWTINSLCKFPELSRNVMGEFPLESSHCEYWQSLEKLQWSLLWLETFEVCWIHSREFLNRSFLKKKSSRSSRSWKKPRIQTGVPLDPSFLTKSSSDFGSILAAFILSECAVHAVLNRAILHIPESMFIPIANITTSLVRCTSVWLNAPGKFRF